MGDMRTVELDDGTAEPAPANHRRRLWPWALAALVVVAAVLVTWQLVENRRQHATQERAAQASNVLLPLPTEVKVLWTSPAADTYLGFAVVGPHLVVGSTDDDGSTYEIHELDRRTGKHLWDVTGTLPAGWVGGVECRPVSPPGGRPTFAACAIGALAPPDQLPTEAGNVRIVVLDAATGTVVSTTDTSLAAWAVAGDTIVMASPERDDENVTWTLKTIDATSGAPTWSLVLPTVPIAPPDTDDGFLTGKTFDASLEGALGRVVLADQGHVWVVDDGTLTTTVPIEAGWTVALDGSGAVVLAFGDGTGTAQLVLTDGTVVDAPAQQVNLPVDDGTASDVLLVRAWKDLALQARDARTGQVRWEVPQAGTQVIVLGGRVILRSGDDLVAADADDGHVVWRTRSIMSSEVALSTDGTNVYVPVPGRLRAYALTDGHRQPDRVLPPEYSGESPVALGGVLTVYSGDPAPILG
ncbi:outer membrane protein assembly factor BamB family protein [Cellulomonas rhizosphaerae]|uniref:Pyrrolo-quinoline quinone repeat domain-containing protein n=1 Tax=Cellulomonas rhizosphaerae TaxID=2293719 RepID=A0A413RLJ7_9CELL|nr:PQQ-binding-like beta-propeller repeat protein [Cellulomonas rhizosphaerae]RHA40970.1 hypothetical protein D1825_09535 [Cellulomonas rhizosphaerae]